MEAEHFTRARLGVAAVGEAGDDAGGFIEEAQGFAGLDPFQLRPGVTLSLQFDSGNVMTGSFSLDFDHTHRLAFDKQDVVGRFDSGLVFA